MRTIILIITFISSAFSQGMYLSKGNGISVGFLYGGYVTDSKFEFTASYSLNGYVDLSYSRSSILTKENTSNFQNEYFIRAYIFKGNNFFFSGAYGYLYQQIKTNLWKDFSLSVIREGFAFEGGVHFATEDQKDKRIVVSVFYRHFEPTEELRTPAGITSDTQPAHSFTFDIAVIYYISKISVIIGPRFVLDNDFKDEFYGLNLSFMYRH